MRHLVYSVSDTSYFLIANHNLILLDCKSLVYDDTKYSVAFVTL